MKMSADTRDREVRRGELHAEILHYPSNEYARRVTSFGVERCLDMDQVIDASWMLRHDINLTRWRDSPAVKRAAREAREAVAKLERLMLRQFWDHDVR